MIGQPGVSESDEDLVALAKTGDRQAFGELIRRHRERVVGVVYRMCGDACLAEDAAQDAFIQAWRKLHRYEPKAPFQNWLYRIAMNRALDVLRREREGADVDDLPLASPNLGPEASAERTDLGEQVRRAVLALPDASRAVLVLREYEDLSYREIAETLDIPVGTVMSRLNYARKLLRTALAPVMEDL
ncbi:MAG: sigma-70 family RNA polymerase sigma factor [Anaerolineae bacterium]|nr:sigma-70 family RNA polymerase sigma factor [Anaerolineae bacterium]